MLLSLLLIIPLIGIFIISSTRTYSSLGDGVNSSENSVTLKTIALTTASINLILSFVIYVFFNSSSNQYQFVQEHYNIQCFDIYLGVDSISIYFVLLTTIIMPIALLSN
jgi:NADH-ubiquinone oxidoreductase chain 4